MTAGTSSSWTKQLGRAAEADGRPSEAIEDDRAVWMRERRAKGGTATEQRHRHNNNSSSNETGAAHQTQQPTFHRLPSSIACHPSLLVVARHPHSPSTAPRLPSPSLANPAPLPLLPAAPPDCSLSRSLLLAPSLPSASLLPRPPRRRCAEVCLLLVAYAPSDPLALLVIGRATVGACSSSPPCGRSSSARR